MAARDTFVFALIILNLQVVLSENIINSLKDILKGNTNPPIVVFLNSNQRSGTIYDFVPDDWATSKAINEKIRNDDVINDVTNENDEGAYMLYHLLRTTQENEELDDESIRNFEQTKDMLRAALRSRCEKLDKCVRMCVKKRYVCQVTCREVYDVYEICQVPVCGSKCWGKTMPPSWLLK